MVLVTPGLVHLCSLFLGHTLLTAFWEIVTLSQISIFIHSTGQPHAGRSSHSVSWRQKGIGIKRVGLCQLENPEFKSSSCPCRGPGGGAGVEHTCPAFVLLLPTLCPFGLCSFLLPFCLSVLSPLLLALLCCPLQNRRGMVRALTLKGLSMGQWDPSLFPPSPSKASSHQWVTQLPWSFSLTDSVPSPRSLQGRMPPPCPHSACGFVSG